jgi:hypothetical protein
VNWNSERMSCDDVRAAIADSVIVGSPDRETDVGAHVATCDACRAYRDDCRRLWSELGALPVPPPAGEARRRLENARGAPPVRTERGWTRRLLIAAGFVVAMAIGYRAASWRSASQMSSSQQYLLLLYDTDATSRLSPAAMSAVVSEYSAWARGLRSRGKLVTAEKLSSAPGEWFGGQVAAVGGEHVGGFFLIRVKSPEEAKQIASECPHVRHGGRVELRAIQKT